jgi:hypothetical protein
VLSAVRRALAALSEDEIQLIEDALFAALSDVDNDQETADAYERLTRKIFDEEAP